MAMVVKTEQEVPGADAVEDEEGADDELGRGDVLAGEEPGELAAGLELVGCDGLPVELVELVHGRGETGPA
jgi:hypothetical protein